MGSCVSACVRAHRQGGLGCDAAGCRRLVLLAGDAQAGAPGHAGSRCSQAGPPGRCHGTGWASKALEKEEGPGVRKWRGAAGPGVGVAGMGSGKSIVLLAAVVSEVPSRQAPRQRL